MPRELRLRLFDKLLHESLAVVRGFVGEAQAALAEVGRDVRKELGPPALDPFRASRARRARPAKVRPGAEDAQVVDGVWRIEVEVDKERER